MKRCDDGPVIQVGGAVREARDLFRLLTSLRDLNAAWECGPDSSNQVYGSVFTYRNVKGDFAGGCSSSSA